MDSIPSPSHSVLSSKQRKLIDELNSVVSQTGIKLTVNPEINASIPCPANTWAVDVEHDEQGSLVGIGLCERANCYYFTVITKELVAILEAIKIIAHNGVSDIECLRMWGINVRDEQLFWDVYLIGHILDSSNKLYGLKDMAKRELGISYPSYDEIVGKRGLKAERVTLDKQPVELTAKYNACDTYSTYALYLKQKKAMGL